MVKLAVVMKYNLVFIFTSLLTQCKLNFP